MYYVTITSQFDKIVIEGTVMNDLNLELILQMFDAIERSSNYGEHVTCSADTIVTEYVAIDNSEVIDSE